MAKNIVIVQNILNVVDFNYYVFLHITDSNTLTCLQVNLQKSELHIYSFSILV